MNHNADSDELDLETAHQEPAEVAVEPVMVEPPQNTSVVELQWKAFNAGVDAMQKLYGGIANVGHRKQWARKAGVPIPGE